MIPAVKNGEARNTYMKNGNGDTKGDGEQMVMIDGWMDVIGPLDASEA